MRWKGKALSKAKWELELNLEQLKEALEHYWEETMSTNLVGKMSRPFKIQPLCVRNILAKTRRIQIFKNVKKVHGILLKALECSRRD